VRKFWIVGHFMPEGPRKTDTAEIKYWQFEPGPTGHPTKMSTVFECTLILEGRVNGQVDGQPVDLAAGEYVVIPPGVVSNLPQIVYEKSAGLTIKAPSIPGSKITSTTEEAGGGCVPADDRVCSRLADQRCGKSAPRDIGTQGSRTGGFAGPDRTLEPAFQSCGPKA
jgi:quercetin dioxygenase-like cupin family protein